MELIFLGTGTSQGVPMIACSCAVCTSTDRRNRRSRTSAHVVAGGRHFQIDAGPEFRVQCIENDIRWIDHFILTHGHADHIVGMDDLRRFCDLLGGTALPVHSTAEGIRRIRAMFPYADGELPAASGYPAFRLGELPERLSLPEVELRSVQLPHGSLSVLGLHFQETASGARLAYFTDCKLVTDEALALAQGADLVVLDGLRLDPHPSHMTIDEAVAAAKRIGGRRTFITHMTHAIDHATWSARLPAGVELAYDGLRITA